MKELSYKPKAASVFRRLEELFSRKAPDRIFARCEVVSHALDVFRETHAEGECPFPDPADRIAFWDAVLAEKIGVEDDEIPSVYLTEMDQGLYAGLLGAEIRFLCDPGSGWISSMAVPLLEAWEGFDALRIPGSHPWKDRYLDELETFTRHAEGKFGVSHFIVIDGLNFLFELFGATRTYLSLHLEPERVTEAIDFAYDLAVLVQDRFFEIAPLVEGGTCSNMMSWIPGGRIVSESVDPFHMTSVEDFERWGREPVERLFRHYDGGVVHLHANGRHLVERVATLEGLRGITFFNDLGYVPSFDLVGEFRRRAGDVPIRVDAPYEDFLERLRRQDLPGGVLYNVREVPDSCAANRLMDQVRDYRV